jgi:hypothetical protein
MVFDTATSSATEIALGSNHIVFGTALGGDAIAFISLNTGNGDIMSGVSRHPGRRL